MFKTVREYTKNGKTESTVKEYGTMEQALAYAKRYGKGDRFLRCRIFDENGAQVYAIEKDGTEKAAEPTKQEQPEKLEKAPREENPKKEAEASGNDSMRQVLGLPGKSGTGDFETEVYVKGQDGSCQKRIVCHRTKNQAMACAAGMVKNIGGSLLGIEVRFRGIVRWTWQGRWIYRAPPGKGAGQARRERGIGREQSSGNPQGKGIDHDGVG